MAGYRGAQYHYCSYCSRCWHHSGCRPPGSATAAGCWAPASAWSYGAKTRRRTEFDTGLSQKMNQSTALRERFHRLSRLLIDQAAIWRPVPFSLPALPWESQQPALAAALGRLSDEHCAALETDQQALVRWLTEYIPALAQISAVDTVAAFSADRTDYPAGFERDIPGRKWRQVSAFAACLEHMGGPVVEWCAGKAHLGRAIAQRFSTPVTALEWNAELCNRGSELSRRLQLDVTLRHCDVLSAAAAGELRQARHAVALHACGDLHRRLIETVIAQATASLDLSPCCYHLTGATHYQPYSQAARDSGLALNRDDCRLAVQETVTAAASNRRRRQQKSAWRLGFDALQRQLRGVDDYLPVPSLPESAFDTSFADFCGRVAALKQLTLPHRVDWPYYQHLGWLRQARVSRMELPRHAFRRALELWLVVDRALYLAECGYHVQVGTFCDRRLTPRNLMIRAHRRPGCAASPA